MKKGYKNTEVGVIPEDWEVKTLGAIANIIGGGTPSSFINIYWNGDINWFTPTEIGNEKYSYQSIRKISKLGFENCSAKMLPVGTILLTTRAGIGDVSILMQEGCTNQGFQSFIVKNEIDNEYLYYLISTLKNIFLQNASGSTFLEISPNKIRAIQIPLPPTTAEQTAIATALSDADALICSLEKLLAKKRNIKQGAMQKLLQPNPEISEDWEVKKLGDVCDIFRGGSPRPIESFLTVHPDGINWIKIGDVKKNAKYIESTDEKIISEGLSRSRYVNEGDFLLSNSMSFGRPYIMKISGCIHDGWLVIQNYQKNFDRDFLYYVLGSEAIMQQYKTMASGSSVLNLSKEIVKNVMINCPKSVEEQTRIATILSDMDDEISALESKLAKYKNIKIGMMQNLLTGKIRLYQDLHDSEINKI